MKPFNPNFRRSKLALSIACYLLSAGTYAQEINQNDDDDVEVINITGIRGSIFKSLDTKRTSTQVVDAISSEDIGKMPDQNIAESLQRVTGIQIDRSGGEGSVVRIRGLSQNLNTINGEKLISGLGQTSQNSSFADLPAELFKQVVVYKSQSANLLEGGVGGVVDLRTRRPFDFAKDELVLFGSVKAAHGLESGSTTPIFSGLAGKNWGKIGALLAISYTERDNLNDEAQFERGFRSTEFDSNGDGVNDSSYNRARMLSAKTGNQNRERLGINGALQWKLSDSLELTTEYFGSFLDIDTETVSVQYWSDRGIGLVTSQPSTISPNGYLESGVINSNFYQANTDVGVQDSSAHNVLLSLDWDNGSQLTGKFQANFASSNLEESQSAADVMGSKGNQVNFPDGTRDFVNPNGIETFTYDLDIPLGTDIPNITSNSGLLEPQRYWFKSQWANVNETDAQQTSLRGDFEYSFYDGQLEKISFGGRIANKDVSRDEYRFLNKFGDYQYYFKDPQISDPDLGYTLLPVVTYADNPNRLFEYKDFFSTSPGSFPSSILVESSAGMYNPEAWLTSLYPSATLTKAFTPLTSYSVDESTAAAYVMADFVGELGDLPYNFNVGVRYVSTEITVGSNDVPATLEDGSVNNNAVPGSTFNGTEISWTPVDNESDYNDVLPSFNATLELSEDLNFKIAAGKTMSRPDLGNLGRGFSISYSGNFEPGPNGEFQRFASGRAGNPKLDPDRATSYDLSLEWYFSEGSALTGGLFYKDIESFSVAESNLEAIPDSDGVVREGGIVSRTVNGQGGFVKGIEIALQHTFDNGLGLLANYTYSDSENKDFLDPTTQKALAIPGVSDEAYNLIGFYENSVISTRIAWNWRSERLTELFSGFPLYRRAYGQLDASFAYKVDEQITVSLEGINLTKNDNSDYLDVEDGEYFYNWRTDESRYILSVNYKL